MGDYGDLIERLEKAEGPDRELDDEISAAMGRPPPKTGGYYGWEKVGGSYQKPRDSEGRTHDIWSSRLYTSSLDAAVGLVPEGWNWQLYGRDVLAQTDHPRGVGRPYCILGLPGTREAGGRGATPALAVIIAVLKARQASGEGS